MAIKREKYKKKKYSKKKRTKKRKGNLGKSKRTRRKKRSRRKQKGGAYHIKFELILESEWRKNDILQIKYKLPNRYGDKLSYENMEPLRVNPGGETEYFTSTGEPGNNHIDNTVDNPYIVPAEDIDITNLTHRKREEEASTDDEGV